MSDSADPPIECRVAWWYHKRMGLMFLMFLAMGAYFFYDHKIGYPKKQVIWDEYEKHEDDFDKWRDIAKEQEWPLEPDEMTAAKIQEQFNWAIGMWVLAAGVSVMFLMNRNKRLSADADSLTTPGGKQVAFKDVFRIDRRKWDLKGLAYAFYKDPEGAKGKATIDDLKFEGAEKVLDRLLANFEGELVDRLKDEEELAEEAEAAAAIEAENGEEVPEESVEESGSPDSDGKS